MMRRHFPFVLHLLVVVLVLQPAPAGADELYPQLSPGEQVRLEMDNGFRNYILIYLPSDYTPDRPWPVVFCYHGFNGNPTVSPIRQMTEGRDAIIVGMDHASETYHQNPARNAHRQSAEIERFDTVLGILDRHLNVDHRRIFMGGFSQGGYTTSVLGEAMLDRLAGLIILGAGRSQGTGNPPRSDLIRNKPIFIGAGDEDDPHGDRAKRAVDTYGNWGADVTADIWPNTGHRADTRSLALRDWLVEHGPLALAPDDFAQAQRLVQREPARAHRLFVGIAALSDNHPLCLQAGEAAEAIEQTAAEALREADTAIENGRMPQAIALLLQTREQYAGLDAAARADARLLSLAGDAELDAAQVRRIVARMGASTRREAQLAIREGRAAHAVMLYGQYIERFPDAPDIRAAQAQIARLKADPATLAQLRDLEAPDACRTLTAWAETYLDCGQSTKARPLLDRIAHEFPGTTYAERAGQWLNRAPER